MPTLSAWSSSFISSLSLFSTCLGETLSFRGAARDQRLALARRSGDTYAPPPVEQSHFLPPIPVTAGEGEDELELLDICLLASVDGKFHAVNRTSGQLLWSMPSTSSTSSPEALRPLVRTQHTDSDAHSQEHEHKELYIIEPQSGDIYVLNRPDAPLQPLPFSMANLVDMSPFSFSDENDGRMFIGKKETSLLILELETGRLKGTVNSECPWDAFGNDADQSSAEIDLDELDGTKPPKEKPVSTEVLIGRTDYYISIHTKPPTPSSPRPPVQNLTFSTYGPNNQDHALQSRYRRTPDDIYVQPMPDGGVMTFQAAPSHPDGGLLWGHTFAKTIVATFDVVRSSSRQHPFVLLQPQPRLQDFLPSFDAHGPTFGGTYIGLVDDDDGSLFAMTQKHFPLVYFHRDPEEKFPTIDAPPGDLLDNDLPPDLDSITRARKLRERCSDGRWDRHCAVGMRPVEASGQSRLSRLLPPGYQEPAHHTHTEEGNLSRPTVGTEPPRVEPSESVRGIDEQKVAGAVLAFLVFLVGLWYLTSKKQGMRRSSNEEPILLSHMPKRSISSANGDGAGHESHLPNGHAVPEVDSADRDSFLDLQKDQSTSLPSPLPPVPATPSTPRPTHATNGIVEGASGEAADDGEGDDDSDKDGDNLLTPGKKKGRRRKRGKKNKAGVANANGEDPPEVQPPAAAEDNMDEAPPLPQSPSISVPTSSQSSTSSPQLIVSEDILGFGSHGTVVYRGSLQGRAVAVKRLLQDFVTVAAREVDILQESDDHPNVIRYFYQERHSNFLYIALELCPASLADVIERPDLHVEISAAFDRKRALAQIASGLRHLHALKIIHRDIKPQNILISSAKKGAGASAGHRMLISDFGLCKKLEVDQTSFLPTAYGALAAGTVGWRAPEILRGEVKLDESAVDDASQSSRSSVGTALNGATPGKVTRLTKAVDIFALGCLFYYTLTSGAHPYGDRYEREVNILKNAKSLGALESFGEEGLEAIDLITHMLDPEAYDRPDTSSCLIHPFFWNPARRLAFLQDASDRFEIMCRDPREPELLELEKGAFNVVGNDWHSRLDKTFIDNLGKFRKYDGRSVQDLMRALRNKKHHYQDLPDNVKRHLGPLPDGFLAYFTRRFPHLFMHVHSVVSRTNLRYESMFKSYFELSD